MSSGIPPKYISGHPAGAGNPKLLQLETQMAHGWHDLKRPQTKVKVIHFGTNRFLIYDFLLRVSIVTVALGRTVQP